MLPAEDAVRRDRRLQIGRRTNFHPRGVIRLPPRRILLAIRCKSRLALPTAKLGPCSSRPHPVCPRAAVVLLGASTRPAYRSVPAQANALRLGISRPCTLPNPSTRHTRPDRGALP